LASEGGEWETASFVYKPGLEEGFSQSHFQQFDNLQLTNITPIGKEWEFAKTANPILIQTKGNDGPENIERRVRVNISVRSLSYNSNDFVGFALAAFNPQNAD